MYGRTSLSTNSIINTRVSADGSPRYKAGGVTIDWSTVVAVSSDTTLTDGSVVKNGNKYLRYGQILTKITATGKFGPYNPDVTDGRELLVRGNIFILDETVLQYNVSSVLGTANDQIGGVFDGGAVFIDRVLHSGTSAHSLAAGPTLAEFLAAFPEVQIVRD